MEVEALCQWTEVESGALHGTAITSVSLADCPEETGEKRVGGRYKGIQLALCLEERGGMLKGQENGEQGTRKD